MKYWLIVFALFGISAAYAASDIVGGQIGQGFTGRWPLAGQIGSGNTTPTNGKILLVDGTSFILQTDAVSKICRAGGC